MNRRALLLVSLGAIVVLAAIGISLIAFTSDADEGSGAPAPGTAPDPGATRFVDPDGAYTLDIADSWTDAPALEAERAWQIDASGDTVTIGTAPAVDTDLDQYLQRVIDEAPDAVEDFRLREFRVVSAEADAEDDEGDSDPPQQLGIVAYEGAEDGTRRGWYKVAVVQDGRVVVATLVTSDTRFDTVRDAVAPYLLTLRPGPVTV